jgi:hypothetical protein
MQQLTDLLESFRVYALCVPCGRMEAVDLDAAVAILGEAGTVMDLRHRVRCRDCGQHTRDIRVVYVGPRERPAAFHYRR